MSATLQLLPAALPRVPGAAHGPAALILALLGVPPEREPAAPSAS